jgi:ribulose-phosphate 3-epimerase
MWRDGARDIGGEKVVQLGLALNPDTPLDAILPYMEKIDFVQCMGIAKIGYQGQPFDDRVLERVNTIRIKYPNMPISIDGGVNHETAGLLKHAGATRLVAGSAIFGAEDIAAAIEELKSA